MRHDTDSVGIKYILDTDTNTVTFVRLFSYELFKLAMLTMKSLMYDRVSGVKDRTGIDKIVTEVGVKIVSV